MSSKLTAHPWLLGALIGVILVGVVIASEFWFPQIWLPSNQWAVKFTFLGSCLIQVVVEKGAVVDAQVKSVVLDPSDHVVLNEQGRKKVGSLLSNPSVANIKTWQFQPENRTTFLVIYVYKIKGEQTRLPENPKVELDLPHLVIVTAKPFKPYCSDCGANISGKPVGRNP